jgi:hypothetical protein
MFYLIDPDYVAFLARLQAIQDGDVPDDASDASKTQTGLDEPCKSSLTHSIWMSNLTNATQHSYLWMAVVHLC